MSRFFKSVADTSRTIIKGAGVICAGSAVGYFTNKQMVSLFKNVKSQIRPYVPASWVEDDDQQARCQPTMIRQRRP